MCSVYTIYCSAPVIWKFSLNVRAGEPITRGQAGVAQLTEDQAEGTFTFRFKYGMPILTLETPGPGSYSLDIV